MHAAFVVHLAHWKITGTTMSPLEPSESMQTLELGYVNAGFIVFGASILATLLVGRFFCGWACHVVAYQDLCAWLLKRIGLKPRPIRSRLLVWVPLGAALYMFLWPTVQRWWAGGDLAALRSHLLTQDLWETFPGPGMAALTIAVDGFLIVYLLGAKGFCTYGCPYGAIFGAVDRWAPGRIRVTDACEGCGHCTATCTSNVRVHLEVAQFGQVVDPGCMKCLDCINVCPKDALYFGFGPLRTQAISKAKTKIIRPSKVYDFTWGEELALAAIFCGALYALRGLYNLVPFLLAIGLSAITAVVALVAWRLVRRRELMFQRLALRTDGRFTMAGVAALAIVLASFAFLVHSSFVQARTHRGERLLLDAKALPPAQRAPLLDASLQDLLAAERIGLVPVGKLQFQIAQILRVQGDRAGAEQRLRRAFDLDRELSRAGLDLTDLLLVKDPPDVAGAAMILREVIEARPGDAEAKQKLAVLEARLRAGGG